MLKVNRLPNLQKTTTQILKLFIFLLLLLTMVACLNTSPIPTGQPDLRVTSTKVLSGTEVANVLNEETQVPVPKSVTKSLTPASTLAAEPPPAIPMRLSVSLGAPGDLRDAVSEMANNQPGSFLLVEEDADVILGISQNNSLATWTYAVAVPFYSLIEDISLENLKLAWASGDLILDGQSEQSLIEFWGLPEQRATVVPTDDLVNTLWAQQSSADEPPITIVPFERLSPRLKVLQLEGQSPVDVTFDTASYALTIPFGLTGTAPAMEKFLLDWSGPQSNRNDHLVTHIAMTGPAGMRRAVADRMEKYGLNYPAEETGPVLQAVDIAHMSNENAFATDCPMPDPYDSINVCNRDEYVELMVWMGIDVNEMTGNHLNDWGSDSLLHTFDLYESLGIQTYGGGGNLAQAQEPLLLEHNGNQIAFVGCNPVGPPSAWARADYPGSLACENYQFLEEQVRELSASGYLVIVTVQYREDYAYAAAGDQRDIFKSLAAEGAMAVSGSHGHHPQGFAFVNDSFVHYGLGNLLADQMWSLETRQMFIDTYLVYDGRLLNVDLWTGLNEDYARVRQMTSEERTALLEVVFAVSEP